MYDLNHLDAGRFIELLQAREDAFASAPATPPPHPYGINVLADALHPKKQLLTVGEITELWEGCRAYSLLAAPNEPPLACFRPGQYISVRIATDAFTTTRSCTICSSPADRSRYLVTVLDTDEATHYIHTHWTVGTCVEASAPLGDFYYEPLRDAGHVLAVAEGTGILPFCSMAHAIADGSQTHSMTLCCLGNAPHFEAMMALAASCPKLTVLKLRDISELPLPHETYTAFLALSRANRAKAAALLQAAPQPPKNMRLSLCHAPADSMPPFPVAVTVRLHDRQLTVRGQSNETVLSILERSGIPAPAHCRSGYCGWCRAKLLQGEVHMPKENDNRRIADLEHNIIHPCCSYPRSDLTIAVSV